MKWIATLLALTTVPALAAHPRKPLYYRMGGKKVVSAAVADFVDRLSSDQRLLADAKLKQIRDATDLAYAKKQVTTRVCELSGGPCRLKGPLLKSSPGHVELQPAQWFYVIQDLNVSLQRSKIPKAEQEEALGLLMKR